MQRRAARWISGAVAATALVTGVASTPATAESTAAGLATGTGPATTPSRTGGAAAAAGRVALLAALGDSYSSGEGNPPFDEDSGKCHRSPVGWPRMIARQDPRIAMAAHIACSGATSRALRHEYNDEPAQLRQLSSLPRRPDLVTITIGGNDIGFGPVLADCYVSDCVLDGTLARTRARIHRQLPRVLARDYRGLKRAAPGATIVVVGYPRLFPTSSSRTTGCQWLSRRERVTLNRLAVALDRTIARTARRTQVRHVSVLRALAGHELCTRDSWVYPITPLGGQLRGHPLRPGQRAIAAIVRPRLDALL